MADRITVVAAVVRRNGKLLLTSRPADKPPFGLEFPGGKVEPGESYGQCIVREMQEELGMEVIPMDAVFDIIHHYPAGAIRLIFLRCIRC